jgi:hypothetical protein
MQDPVIYKEGEDYYQKTFSGTSNRWGDYSHTVIDPSNDRDLWTIQEYAGTRVGTTGQGSNDSRWGTWWAKVEAPVVANTFPDAMNDSATIAEDSGSNAINVLANDIDVDGDTLTISSNTNGSNGTVAITEGGTSVTYTPNANFSGTDSFIYTVSDGRGGTDTATVNVTVTSVNDPPVANDDSASVAEDSGANTLNVRANDTDPDGNTLSVTVVTQGTNGTVAITGSGTGVSYTPATNFNGSDSFTYTISDGNGGTDTATVNVTVTSVNDAPDAVNDETTVAEDSSANAVNVLSNDTDADGDTLSITAKTNGTNGTVTITGGGTGVTYTPNANFNGLDSFTYTVSDGNGGTDTASVNVTITSINDNPDAVDDAATVAEDSGANSLNVVANDTDSDGDTLSITAKTNGTNGTVTITGGGTGVTYTPNANFNGSDSFTYTISDGNGGTDTATVNITVTSVNDAPDAVNDSATVDEDSGANALSVLANDSILPDTGETLSITAKTNGANGTVVITGGGTGLTYTPAAGYVGSDSFTYTISDGNGGSDTATVSVTVNPANDAPVFVNISPVSQTVDYSDAVQPVAITVSDIDNAASSLVVTAVGLPNGLTLAQTPGTGQWTISGNINVPAGSYQMQLKVTDPLGAFTTTAVNAVIITVNKEKTATAYTGDQNIMTSSPSITTATVRLGARLTQQADGFAGDITKAKVTFELFKNGNIGGTPDLVVSNVSVNSSGDALATVSGLAADTYNINVKVDSANTFWVHSNVDIGILNITVPTNDRRSSGGGWVPDSTSGNGKANFGFTVRPGSGNAAAPKGNSTFVFRGLDGYNYVVKGNSWQGGYLQFSAEPGTTIFTRSNFKGNCNVQKIDPATGLVVQSWGNFSFEVFSKDGDLLNPRAADAYSITVWDRDGLVWHQVGSSSSLVNLGGGNITNKSK